MERQRDVESAADISRKKVGKGPIERSWPAGHATD